MKKKLILKNKYFVVATIISIVVCLSIVFVASYAFFTTRTETKEFVIYTGTLEVNHQKSNNTIDLINLKPVIDSEGLNTEPHTFTVTNNGTMDARYLVRLELDNTIGDLVPLEYVKISYSINNGSYSDPVLLSDLSSNLSFYKSNTLAVNSLDTISLKMWIDLNAPNEIANKQFKARIVVDSIQDVDDGFVVDTAPIIHLNKDSNGNYDLVLPIGSTYTELGVLSVEDDKDNISVSSVNTTYQFFNGIDVVDIESINMNNAGVYYVVYTVSDSYGNIGRSVRQVFVSNNTLPSISLKGNSSVDIYLNSTYTESGVNYDSNNRLLTFGSVDTNNLGTYIIRYIVIDNNGNMNSVTRTVNVIKKLTLSEAIFANNTAMSMSPTLTISSPEISGPAFNISLETNSGDPTYYFSGGFEYNYVSFAGFTWRIVRINEDGTIRLVSENPINSQTTYVSTGTTINYRSLYYTNSEAKTLLDTWYLNNLDSYSDYIATGDYFCEEAKVIAGTSSSKIGNVTMNPYSNYILSFKCNTDANGYGLVNSNIGLLTYDEVASAGCGYNTSSHCYLSGSKTWTMSPSGVTSFILSVASVWVIDSTNKFTVASVTSASALRAVINLKADVTVTGSGYGSLENPYVVE